MRKANYAILSNDNTHITLEDIGPWNIYLTITNDIDNIVSDLYKKSLLTNEKEFSYIDSDGFVTYIKHKDGKFISFL